jgi:serine protease
MGFGRANRGWAAGRWAIGLGAALLALMSAQAATGSKRSAVEVAARKHLTTAQLIVKLRRPTEDEKRRPLGANRVAELSASAGVPLAAVRAMSGDATVLRLMRAQSVDAARAVADRLKSDPNVEWAEPDLPVRAYQTTPPDSGYRLRQWNLFAPNDVIDSPGLLPGSGPRTFVTTGGANLPGAWAITRGAPGIVVAVVDTGITFNHPDLSVALLPGYDMVSSNAGSGAPFNAPINFTANDGDGRDPDATDPGNWITAQDKSAFPEWCDEDSDAGNNGFDSSSWHGTIMTGILAAQWGASGPPGTSSAGIAPEISIVPVRGLGRCGGLLSDIADSIRWAAGLPVTGTTANNANPARVINLSLGTASGSCSNTYAAAINEVVARGVIVVAASGNEGSSGVSQPANCAGVIAVTAHTISGENADYANVGPEIAISAPGGGEPVDFSSTNPTEDDTGYYVWSTSLFGEFGPNSTDSLGRSGPAISGLTGTSGATPHVSGAIALMLSVNPSLNSATIVNVLRSTARPHPAGSFCTRTADAVCGAGLLDVSAAVAAVAAVTPTPSPPPSGGGGDGGGGAVPWGYLLLFAVLATARRRGRLTRSLTPSGSAPRESTPRRARFPTSRRTSAPAAPSAHRATAKTAIRLPAVARARA